MIGTDRAARYRLVEMTAFRCRFFPVDGAVPLGGGDALQGDSSMAEQRWVALVTGWGKPDGICAAIARKLSAESGRAQVWTPGTNAHLVCRISLEKRKQHNSLHNYSKLITSSDCINT